MSRTLLFVVTFASGCSAWHWQVDPAPAVLEAKRPERLRVMLVDSSKVPVWEPVITRDTLHGFAADTGETAIAIPLADIRRVELYEFDLFATISVMFGAAVLFLLYVAAHIPYT